LRKGNSRLGPSIKIYHNWDIKIFSQQLKPVSFRLEGDQRVDNQWRAAAPVGIMQAWIRDSMVSPTTWPTPPA
jgi:hypothetical protein